MKLLLFLSLLLTSTLCLTTLEMRLLGDLFKTWIIAYKKQYPTMGQEASHCARFIINYMAIQDFNAQNEGVTLAINEFADLSPQEFAALYTGTYAPRSPSQGPYKVFDTKNLPSSFDWRDKGAVTPVKNQGACGSCWAFSATGALEGLYFVNNSKLVSFSEQNLVDCVIEDFGCGGGWPIDAMSYSAKEGILSEDDYPCIAHRQKCAFDASKAYHVNDGYFNVTPNNLDQMKAAINTQPISIGIQANQLVFQFYKSGVIKKFCGDSIDHGVLIVGYKEVSGTEAFIVKNSWGPKWGVDGYVYISTDSSANNGKGVCGILSMGAAPYKNKRSISL